MILQKFRDIINLAMDGKPAILLENVEESYTALLCYLICVVFCNLLQGVNRRFRHVRYEKK